MKFSRSTCAKAGAAVLAVAALATASVAHARSNVYFSVGANVVPGVTLGVSNGPIYYPPPQYPTAYAAPVYVQPAPVYYGAGPVVYGPSYYVRPAPVVYYGGARHYRHGYVRARGGRHWN